MAETGDPAAKSGVKWPTYRPDSSLGLNIVNATTVGKIDYSMCGFWEGIYEVQLREAAGMGNGNGTSGRNASVSSNGTQVSSPSPSAFTGGAGKAVEVGSVVLWSVVLVLGLLVV